MGVVFLFSLIGITMFVFIESNLLAFISLILTAVACLPIIVKWESGMANSNKKVD